MLGIDECIIQLALPNCGTLKVGRSEFWLANPSHLNAAGVESKRCFFVVSRFKQDEMSLSSTANIDNTPNSRVSNSN